MLDRMYTGIGSLGARMRHVVSIPRFASSAAVESGTVMARPRAQATDSLERSTSARSKSTNPMNPTPEFEDESPSAAARRTTQMAALNISTSRHPNMVVVGGPEQGRFIEVDNATMSVGRLTTTDIFLNSPTISERHALISRSKDGQLVTITDLDSSNGVLINEIRAIPNEPCELRHGDIIRLGDQQLLYKAPMDMAPAPPVSGGSRRPAGGSRTELVRAQELQLRATMGRFIIMLTIGMTIVSWLLGVAPQITKWAGSSTFVSVPLFVLGLVVLGIFMAKTRYPLSFYGLTLQGWRRSLTEGIVFTLPVMALVVGIKVLLIRFSASFADAPVFGYGTPEAPEVTPLLLLGYVLFVPVQELLNRGAVQTGFEHFFVSKHRTWLAIFFSSLFFATAHLYISPTLAGASFVAGLLWGWLFARHRSLLGVTVSHIILGAWAFFVVDLRFDI